MLGFRNSISVPSLKKEFSDDWALSFDGVDDGITLQNAFNYTSHSISCWVKVGDGTGNRIVFDSRDAGNDGILIFCPTNDKLRYHINGTEIAQTSADTTNYQHIVCTYDGETQRVYVNGSLNASQALVTTVSVTTPAKIGNKTFASGGYWLGLIDDVGIFSSVLSADEVTEIYNSGTPLQLNCNNNRYTSAEHLRGYYMFENEAGGTNIINDYSSRNNYGTKSGATYTSTTP